MLKRMMGAGIIIALISIAMLAWLVWQPIAISSVEVEIAAGSSNQRIANTLKQHGIIRSAWAFRILSRWRGATSQLQAGHYHFAGEMHTAHVLDQLVRGDVMQYPITIPEGLRNDEIMQLLADKTQTDAQQWHDALRAVIGEQNPEGQLLPETYTYTLPLKPEQLLERMRQAQHALLQSISPEQDQWQRIRIVASIVEKETSLNHERPWVAAAIYNRLQQRMRLQMDPTVIYGMVQRDGSFSGNITHKDLKADTPWNTYTRFGLPPTPICNPGTASLRAAMQPADVDYVYFVADGSGGHRFASTLKEHQANVQHWLKVERAP